MTQDRLNAAVHVHPVGNSVAVVLLTAAAACMQAGTCDQFQASSRHKHGGNSSSTINMAPSDAKLRKHWTPLASPRGPAGSATMASSSSSRNSVAGRARSGGHVGLSRDDKQRGRSLVGGCGHRGASRRRVSVAACIVRPQARPKSSGAPQPLMKGREQVEDADLARELMHEVTQVPASAVGHVAEAQRRFHDSTMEWLQGAVPL